jgi:hypothetical protein
VDDSGIWAGFEGDDKEYLWPWPEVVDAAAYALELPSGERLVYLDISHTSGEFMEVMDTVDGFDEVVAALAARAGRRVPRLSALPEADGQVQVF